MDRYQTGQTPPDDIEFEDLGNEDNKSINSSSSKVKVISHGEPPKPAAVLGVGNYVRSSYSQ